MKSLFVVAISSVNRHVGEYYDDIIEVEDQPTTITIVDWANRIRGHIRKLWNEDKNDQNRVGDPVVSVNLDAASPFNCMLIDYQIVMGKEEGIKIQLSYDTVKMRIVDPETIKLLSKLDKNKGGQGNE